MIDHPEVIHSCQCYDLHDIYENSNWDEIPEIEDYEWELQTQPFQTQSKETVIIVSPKDINSEWYNEYDVNGMYQSNNDILMNISSNQKIDPSLNEIMDLDYSDDEESTMSFYSHLMTNDDEHSSIVETSHEDSKPSSYDYSMDHELDYSVFGGDGSINPYSEVDYDVVLNPSKAPVVEALAFCVVMRIGAYQTPDLERKNQLAVTDLNRFLDGIKHFCTKKNPTEKEEARVKALKLWFNSIPKRNVRDKPFIMNIKPTKVTTIQSKIKRMKKFVVDKGLLNRK